MAVHTLDQKHKQQFFKKLQRTRLIWLLAVLVLVFPTYQWSYVGSTSLFTPDTIYYLVLGFLILFYLYTAVPRIFDGYEIEVDQTGIRRGSPRPFNLPWERVWFVREGSTGLFVYSRMGRKLLVPREIKRFDAVKAEVLGKIDAKSGKWTRIPTLWFWVFIFLFSLAAGFYFGVMIYAYSGLIVTALNISFILYFE